VFRVTGVCVLFGLHAMLVERAKLLESPGKRTGDQTYRSPEVAGSVGAGLIQRY
jgi:hypothetical protein